MPSDYGEPQPFTIEDLVELGNGVLQTLSSVGQVRMIPGCCTQGCCDQAVLEVLGRRSSRET